MKLRSSIKTSLIRQTLLKGYFFASIGVFFLLLPAIFIPVTLLKIFGPFCVILSFLFITIGLLPFKRLKKLEISPHEISLLEDKRLLFSLKRKPTFILDFDEIDKLLFNDLKTCYGISFYLKKNNSLKIVDPHFDMTHFQINSKKYYGCDLFLPYFSKRSFEQVLNCIKGDDKADSHNED